MIVLYLNQGVILVPSLKCFKTYSYLVFHANIPHSSNHTGQSASNANRMPRQSCDRTRLAPRRLKQLGPLMFFYGFIRLPALAREQAAESHGGWSWGAWVHFLSTVVLLRASCNGFVAVGWGPWLERSGCEWPIAVFLGLLTDGKACRLYWAIFSCKLVCRFSDAGPGEL